MKATFNNSSINCKIGPIDVNHEATTKNSTYNQNDRRTRKKNAEKVKIKKDERPSAVDLRTHRYQGEMHKNSISNRSNRSLDTSESTQHKMKQATEAVKRLAEQKREKIQELRNMRKQTDEMQQSSLELLQEEIDYSGGDVEDLRDPSWLLQDVSDSSYSYMDLLSLGEDGSSENVAHCSTRATGDPGMSLDEQQRYPLHEQVYIIPWNDDFSYKSDKEKNFDRDSNIGEEDVAKKDVVDAADDEGEQAAEVQSEASNRSFKENPQIAVDFPSARQLELPYARVQACHSLSSQASAARWKPETRHKMQTRKSSSIATYNHNKQKIGENYYIRPVVSTPETLRLQSDYSLKENSTDVANTAKQLGLPYLHSSEGSLLPQESSQLTETRIEASAKKTCHETTVVDTPTAQKKLRQGALFLRSQSLQHADMQLQLSELSSEKGKSTNDVISTAQQLGLSLSQQDDPIVPSQDLSSTAMCEKSIERTCDEAIRQIPPTIKKNLHQTMWSFERSNSLESTDGEDIEIQSESSDQFNEENTRTFTAATTAQHLGLPFPSDNDPPPQISERCPITPLATRATTNDLLENLCKTFPLNTDGNMIQQKEVHRSSSSLERRDLLSRSKTMIKTSRSAEVSTTSFRGVEKFMDKKGDREGDNSITSSLDRKAKKCQLIDHAALGDSGSVERRLVQESDIYNIAFPTRNHCMKTPFGRYDEVCALIEHRDYQLELAKKQLQQCSQEHYQIRTDLEQKLHHHVQKKQQMEHTIDDLLAALRLSSKEIAELQDKYEALKTLAACSDDGTVGPAEVVSSSDDEHQQNMHLSDVISEYSGDSQLPLLLSQNHIEKKEDHSINDGGEHSNQWLSRKSRSITTSASISTVNTSSSLEMSQKTSYSNPPQITIVKASNGRTSTRHVVHPSLLSFGGISLQSTRRTQIFWSSLAATIVLIGLMLGSFVIYTDKGFLFFGQDRNEVFCIDDSSRQGDGQSYMPSVAALKNRKMTTRHDIASVKLRKKEMVGNADSSMVDVILSNSSSQSTPLLLVTQEIQSVCIEIPAFAVATHEGSLEKVLETVIADDHELFTLLESKSCHEVPGFMLTNTDKLTEKLDDPSNEERRQMVSSTLSLQLRTACVQVPTFFVALLEPKLPKQWNCCLSFTTRTTVVDLFFGDWISLGITQEIQETSINWITLEPSYDLSADDTPFFLAIEAVCNNDPLISDSSLQQESIFSTKCMSPTTWDDPLQREQGHKDETSSQGRNVEMPQIAFSPRIAFISTLHKRKPFAHMANPLNLKEHDHQDYSLAELRENIALDVNSFAKFMHQQRVPSILETGGLPTLSEKRNGN